MQVESLIARSKGVTPGGIHSQRRQMTPPLCFEKAQGSRVWDLDGNEYIEYHGAYGCMILGHANARLSGNVAAALDCLDLIGLGVTPSEVELAELLVKNVPCFEQVLLCNTGSEATLHAVRLARGVTGRKYVLKFQGAYHGTHDYLLSNTLASVLTGGGEDPDPQAGVLASAVDATIVCRYNDLDSVRAVAADSGQEVAAIFVEPYAHNIGGAAPRSGFLEGLRELADEIGAVLVFDEVITGVRHGLGGYQAITGVTPDLATLAKALGNGMPIGAVGGRRDYMEHFNTAPSGDVLYSGTFNGGGGPVAAALTVLELLAEPGAYERLYAMGDRLRAGLADAFEAAGVPAVVGGYGSVAHILFAEGGGVMSQEDVGRNDISLYSEFRRRMLANGILDTPETQAMRSYISLAHTESDIEQTVEAAEKSIKEARAAVLV